MGAVFSPCPIHRGLIGTIQMPTYLHANIIKVRPKSFVLLHVSKLTIPVTLIYPVPIVPPPSPMILYNQNNVIELERLWIQKSFPMVASISPPLPPWWS